VFVAVAVITGIATVGEQVNADDSGKVNYSVFGAEREPAVFKDELEYRVLSFCEGAGGGFPAGRWGAGVGGSGGGGGGGETEDSGQKAEGGEEERKW